MTLRGVHEEVVWLLKAEDHPSTVMHGGRSVESQIKVCHIHIFLLTDTGGICLEALNLRQRVLRHGDRVGPSLVALGKADRSLARCHELE